MENITEKYLGDNMTQELGETLSCFVKNARAIEPFLDSDTLIYIVEDEAHGIEKENYFFSVSKPCKDDIVAAGFLVYAEDTFFVNAYVGGGCYYNDSFTIKDNKVIATYFEDNKPINATIPFDKFFKSMKNSDNKQYIKK